MQRIGRVLHVGSDKNIVLKAENLPRLGGIVFDKQLKPTGTVIDVFGPIFSPYAVVKSSITDPNCLVNQVLYVDSLSRSRTERKR